MKACKWCAGTKICFYLEKTGKKMLFKTVQKNEKTRARLKEELNGNFSAFGRVGIYNELFDLETIPGLCECL